VALAVLEDRIEGSLELERVHLLPGSLSLKGLKYSQQGLEIAAENARIEFSLTRLLRGKEINLSKIEVSGLSVDVSRILEESPRVYDAEPTMQTRRPVPSDIMIKPGKESFAGLLPYTDIGYRFWVNRLSVEGKVLLPASRKIEFFLEGGDVRPGTSATLSLTGSLIDQNPDAPISRMNFDGKLMLEQNPDSGLSMLQMVTTVYARGAAFEGEIALRKEVAVEKTETGGESHSLRVAVIDSTGREEALFDLTDEYNPQESLFRGRFSLNSSSDQLKPFAMAMGAPLPDFTTEGSGTFEYSLTGGMASLRAVIDGQVDGLETVWPHLKEVPPLAVHSEIDLQQSGSSYWINKLIANLDNTEDGKRVARLASSGPFRIDPDDDDFGFQDAEGELLTLAFDDMPTDWFTHLVTEADESLYGGRLIGRVALIKEKSELRVQITKPLQIRGISYRKGGEEYFQNIDVFMRGNLGLSENELRFTLNSMELRSGRAQLMEASLEGKFNMTEDGEEKLQLDGRLIARLNEFYKQPIAEVFAFPGFSALNLEQSFRIVLGDEFLRFENLAGKLTNDAGESFFQEHLLQPVSIRLPLGDEFLSAVEASGDLLRFEFSGFPLELIASHVPDYELTDGTISGEFTLGSVDGNIELRSEAPLSMIDLNLADKDGQLLKNFSLSLVPEFSFDQNKLNFAWTDLVARSGWNHAVTGNGEVTFDFNRESPVEKASGDLQADIAILARQPFFSKISIADSGLVALSGKFDLNDRVEFSGQILLQDLHATSDPEIEIQRGTLSVEGTLADGRIQLKAPFTLLGKGGDSDILFSLWLEPQSQEKGARFKFFAQGKNLVLADMFSLAGFLEPNEEAAEPAETERPKRTPTASVQRRDQESFWKGYSGEATVDFGRVVYPGIGQLDKVRAIFRASDRQLLFETDNTGSGGNPLNLQGRIDFKAGRSKPYSLQAQLGLSDFDVGSFLRQSDPRQRPMVEGIFNLTGNLTGEAENLDRLLQTAQGDFYLENRSGGIFRPLPLDDQKTQVATFAIAGLDLLAGKKVRQLNTATRAAKLLREVEFDDMKIKASRGSNLNIDLTDLWVRGPEIIISGTGSVSYREGVPLLDQPLLLKAQMAAKNEAAYLLNELGHLQDRQTEDGYYYGPSFSITGTLGNPDKSELDRLLQSSTLGFLGVGGRKVDLGKSDQSVESTPSQTETDPGGENLQQTPAPSKEEKILKSIFKIITDR